MSHKYRLTTAFINLSGELIDVSFTNHACTFYSLKSAYETNYYLTFALKFILNVCVCWVLFVVKVNLLISNIFSDIKHISHTWVSHWARRSAFWDCLKMHLNFLFARVRCRYHVTFGIFVRESITTNSPLWFMSKYSPARCGTMENIWNDGHKQIILIIFPCLHFPA